MKIKIQEREAPGNAAALAYARSLVPEGKHNDWLEFLGECNGCGFEPNEFLDGVGGLRSVWSTEELKSELLDYADVRQRDLLPFGDAEGGNLVCLDLSDVGVCFWDHETETTTRVANSFREFLELLDHVDLSSVQKDDATTVTNVSIAPGFLESLGAEYKKDEGPVSD